jgi:O-methyltransferase domain
MMRPASIRDETFDAPAARPSRAAAAATAIAHAYDFSNVNCVVDIGGGEGHLMAAVLAVAPHAHGIVFERVPTLALAWRTLKNAGLGARTECAPGTLFEAMPRGGDLYLLNHILSNWNDSTAIAILRRCAMAMKPHATLLIAEHVFLRGSGRSNGEPLTDRHGMATTALYARTEREYLALLNQAGFGFTQSIGTASPLRLIEARR